LTKHTSGASHNGTTRYRPNFHLNLANYTKPDTFMAPISICAKVCAVIKFTCRQADTNIQMSRRQSPQRVKEISLPFTETNN